MMRISAFVVSFLLFGLLFTALPQNSYAGIGMTTLGCCFDNNNECLSCGIFESCAVEESQCDTVNGNFSEGLVCFETQLSACADPGTDAGCCILARGECEGGISLNQCSNSGGAGWLLDQDCNEIVQCAGLTRNVPSLSQWGLIAVAAALGVVGLFGVLRRKAIS